MVIPIEKSEEQTFPKGFQLTMINFGQLAKNTKYMQKKHILALPFKY